MAKLTYHGATLPRAAELAAFFSHTQTSHPMKAASLEKEFPKHRDRLSDFTQMIFEDRYLTEDEKAETRRLWKAAIDQKFVIPEHMIGKRR